MKKIVISKESIDSFVKARMESDDTKLTKEEIANIVIYCGCVYKVEFVGGVLWLLEEVDGGCSLACEISKYEDFINWMNRDK